MLLQKFEYKIKDIQQHYLKQHRKQIESFIYSIVINQYQNQRQFIANKIQNQFLQNLRSRQLIKKMKSSNIKEDKLQECYKQLLNNYKKLPVSKCQLYQVYFTYLDVHQMEDKNSNLLQKIVQTNYKSILSQFKSFMHKVFQSFDSIVHKIYYPDDLQQLDNMVLRNAPSFIIEDQNRSQKNKISQSIIKSKITPTGQEKPQKINQQNRDDIIFGYLFQKIHTILLKYKDYYQLQNLQNLQEQIYQSFLQYVKENQQVLPKTRKILSNQQSNKKENNKILNQRNQKQQKGRSDLVDQIIDVVIQNAQDAKIIKKAQQNQKSNGIKINNYQVSPLRIFGNAGSFFQNVYKQGLTKTLTSVFHFARQKSLQKSHKKQVSPQQEILAFNLYQTILQNHKRHNLTKQYGLVPQHFKLVQQFMDSSKRLQFQTLNGLFNQQQKNNLIQILDKLIQSPQLKIQYSHVLYRLDIFKKMFENVKVKQKKQSSKILGNSKKGIKTTLSAINTISQLPNIFYFISFLYRSFYKNYTPACRRIITRVCHQVQQKFKKMQSQDKQYRKFGLVHSLKLLQSQMTKRSQLCRIITNQKPFRQSQLPLVHQKKQYFQEFNKQPFYQLQQAQQKLQIQLARIHIEVQKKKYKQIPKLQLLKLTHSKYRKTVTILISGFLSQDTNKFDQWMGILQPTYDSQIYALKWESKTIQNILAYTIDTCKDVAIAGGAVGMFGGPYFKAAMILKQIITKYNQNPFTPCFEVATKTGVFLADLIISLFDGHFINLAGFSLGTQVISSALNHLKSKGKLHLINRIITMGGVADKKQLKEMLQKTQQIRQNPIQISWTNVYCQKDNILRYLLRLSMPSIDPVGLSAVVDDSKKQKVQKQEQSKQTIKQKIYQIENINVTQFVNGHLSYRTNMRNIARLIGIKDQ